MVGRRGEAPLVPPYMKSDSRTNNTLLTRMIHQEPRKTRKLTEVEELQQVAPRTALVEQDVIPKHNFLLFFPSVTFRVFRGE